MSLGHLHKPSRQLNGFSLYFSGEVAIIVIDRGENRLNIEFLETFNVLLDDVERNESCKGLITTGTGKFYGNGIDLQWLTTSPERLPQFVSLFHATLKRILYFPIATLAALNGHAYAGGAVFAFAHDLRTARVDKGWMCFNEVFIQRRFSNFILALVRAKLGNGKNFSDALVLARRYTAQEAFDCGLVHAIASETLLIPESVRVLKSYYGKTGFPRESLVNMKLDVYNNVLEVYEDDEKNLGEMKSKL